MTTSEADATHVGAEVLRHGGNAVDAAVAVGFALAVTHPSAGNIGGGGFMLVRPALGATVAIDFRETAASAGTVATNRAMLASGATGYKSAAVPGTVAGLVLALETYGTRPLAEVLAPGIELARSGHVLKPRQAELLSWSWAKLKNDGPARAVWGHGFSARGAGERVAQPDLARTLEAIARGGRKAFYEGEVAVAIDRAMRTNGGLVTMADLAAYRAVLRLPIDLLSRSNG